MKRTTADLRWTLKGAPLRTARFNVMRSGFTDRTDPVAIKL